MAIKIIGIKYFSKLLMFKYHRIIQLFDFIILLSHLSINFLIHHRQMSHPSSFISGFLSTFQIYIFQFSCQNMHVYSGLYKDLY